MKKHLKNILRDYRLGRRIKNDFFHKEGIEKITLEQTKIPNRSNVINYLLSSLEKSAIYLEIGVRFPEENFDKIICAHKISVDPGKENLENPVNFKMTSDQFFKLIRTGEILDKSIRFDVIFIDGLHLANQVDRDIENALEFLNYDGFIVLHDCNPPTAFHASEIHKYKLSPSKGYWNGTTWKAFFNFRKNNSFYSCCVDTDWGVGIISKKINLGKPTTTVNQFYEYSIFDEHRKNSLNLMTFEEFKQKLLEEV